MEALANAAREPSTVHAPVRFWAEPPERSDVRGWQPSNPQNVYDTATTVPKLYKTFP